MDKEQKKRITSNITFLKERLGYLDPILERLVDKNVISVEQKDRVEKVNPPTPHRKFNEFIQLLLNSHEPHAFNDMTGNNRFAYITVYEFPSWTHEFVEQFFFWF